MKFDHSSKFSNLSNWKVEAWKNQGFNGIRTHDLRDTGAMLYQLSYEATHWEQGQFIEFISSRTVKSCEIYGPFVGNFRNKKVLIICILLLLRMSANAYAYVKVWTSPTLLNFPKVNSPFSSISSTLQE